VNIKTKFSRIYPVCFSTRLKHQVNMMPVGEGEAHKYLLQITSHLSIMKQTNWLKTFIG